MAAVKNELIWMVFSLCYIASAVEKNITAAPGQTVSLPCRAPSNTLIIVVEWTRPELEPEYVALYRDKKPVPYQQNPSFQDRVELKDRQMKGGDVSMILKNVTSSDTGTYECRIFQRKTNRRKRATLLTEPISTIYLEVQSGDKEGRGDEEGNARLGVGLSALFLAVVGAGAFIVYRKRRGPTEQSPYKAAAPDEESQPA